MNKATQSPVFQLAKGKLEEPDEIVESDVSQGINAGLLVSEYYKNCWTQPGLDLD